MVKRIQQNKPILRFKKTVFIIVLLLLVYYFACLAFTNELLETIDKTIDGTATTEEIEEYGTGFFKSNYFSHTWNRFSSFQRQFVYILPVKSGMFARAEIEFHDVDGNIELSSFDLSIPLTWKDGHWVIGGRIDGCY